MARNRYGWNKRTKEIARKQKSEEKLKRRQSKTLTPPAEEIPEAVAELTSGPSETTLPETLMQVHPAETDKEKI